MNGILETCKVNGIDVDSLRTTIAAITERPEAGATHWSVHSTWRGGTRSDHQVDGVRIGDTTVPRRFTIHIDEPRELCGSNQYPNPQEYLMSALNACMMVGYAAVAALMGVRLTKLEIEIDGDIDLRGFLGIDPAVSPGYDRLRQTVHIAGDGTPEQFAKLHETVKATSPNFFNITRAIPVNSRMVVES